MNNVEITPQFEQVLSFVNQTNHLIFLTGKAGTGKTTLLKYIRQSTFKQMSVVAPTGVAAINAGGSTIHSFFQFPFSPFLPAVKESGDIDTTKNLPVLKYNSQRLSVFRNLELLVIDEISMVRADLLDQIDITLRQTRKKWHLPFGGVQVLLIGDMYQLPPVVQREEWKLLSEVYRSPYFFESLVMRHNPPVYIELDKIYRQSEQTFIQLLNKVRNNQLDQQSLDLLNSHYKSNITLDDYRNNITLTTHNRKADEINSGNLNALQGSEFKFRCEVEGSFPDRNYPADEELVLKKGTRVMFLKNNVDKNYYNGKIGIVSYMDKDKIKVKCDEDAEEIEVAKETWTNVSYKLDKTTKHIDEEILGTFVQYPLRLAWAITIHKSQGLTFDKLIIDAAESFSAGQVYVALSRCRGLNGLTLSSRIGLQSLMNDNQILNFSSSRHNNEQINSIFSISQRTYMKQVLTELFDFSELFQNRNDLAGILQLYTSRINTDGQTWSTVFFAKIDSLAEVSVKFKNQLAYLIDKAPWLENDPELQERIKKAAAYFEVETKQCLEDLKSCSIRTESKEAASELNELLQQLFDAMFLKHGLLGSCLRGFIFADFIKHKLNVQYPDFKISVYSSAKNTSVSADVKHQQLYRELALMRDKICNENELPVYMVANAKTLAELSNYLPVSAEQLLQISGFGKAKVEAYGEEFLQIIKNYMRDHDLESAMDELKPNLLYKQGFKLDEIAKKRGFTLSTVESHLVPYIVNGTINIDELVSRKKKELILRALEDFNYETGIGPVKKNLPEDISWSEIRYVMADKFKGE
jgi:hypothetical protein